MRMAKKVLPVLMVGVVLTACGNGNGKVDKNNEVTMERLIEANKLDSLLGTHNMVGINTIYFDEEGDELLSTYSAISAAMGDYIATYEDSTGYIEFTTSKCVYI